MTIVYLKHKFDRSLTSSPLWQLVFYLAITLFFFVFCVGVYLLSGAIVYDDDGSETVFGFWQTLRLFLNSNSWLDRLGCTPRTGWLLFIEVMGTILLSGVIVAVITNIVFQTVGSIKSGHKHYKFKGHVVIIGFDNIVPSIVRAIMDDAGHKDCRIVIQTSSRLDKVNHAMQNLLSEAEMERVVFVHAPRLSAEELRLLYTHNAREIFIVGDRTLDNHDAENMHTFEELVHIHKEQNAEQKSLTVWFENEASYAALQLNDISAEWKRYFDFRPYNFYKRWANRLLTNSKYGAKDRQISYPELDHEGISADSKKHIHLIIVGMNRMGVALAKEAAHLLHFPNFDETTGKNRTRITFIDDHADTEKDFFLGRHPGYFKIAPVEYKDFITGNDISSGNMANFLDVQFEFIKGRVESQKVREWLCEQLKDEDAIITIAICLENPSQSIGMAMYLPEEVYTRGRKDVSRPWEVTDKDQIVNIFVRQEKTGALIKTFSDSAKDSSAKNQRYANLYPFGMIDDSFSLDYYSNHLAMAFNYIYGYYFDHNETLPSSIPAKEELKKQWKDLSVALQWSNLYLADSIEFKLRSIGLDAQRVKTATIFPRDMENLARAEHGRWNMEKLMLGYRPLDEEEKKLSSAERKQLKNHFFAHQLIVPYDDLSEYDKNLDRNIIIKLPDIIRMINSETI